MNHIGPEKGKTLRHGTRRAALINKLYKTMIDFKNRKRKKHTQPTLEKNTKGSTSRPFSLESDV